MYDVAIIGVGVVGALTARELSKYQVKVCMLEKGDDVAMGATKANSAIVHGGFDPEPGTLKAKLNVEGTRMMPELTAQLHVPYQQNGSLVLAFSEEEAKHVKMLYERGLENGVPELEILDHDQLLAMEPNLSDNVVCGLLSKWAGIICPYYLTIAAAGNAMDNGADLMTNFEVTSITEDAEGFTISNGEKEIRARYIIDSAGVHADEVAALIGDTSFSVVPKKGEYLLLDKNEGGLVKHTIFQVPTAAGKGILVTPTVDGNILVGPTSEAIDSKEDNDTTLKGLDTVRATALKSVKEIPFRSVINSFAGSRASVAGGDFILRPSEKSSRFILAGGIDSPGLSSSPAIAVYLTQILKENGLELVENPSFDGTRTSNLEFREMSMEEKNEVIKKDSRYGHMICRCETVTEGEIVQAIHQNPPARTMDAVKRRSRAGMGRCQSGFCTTYIVEILARELGIPEEEVTKFGKQANLLVGKTKE